MKRYTLKTYELSGRQNLYKYSIKSDKIKKIIKILFLSDLHSQNKKRKKKQFNLYSSFLKDREYDYLLIGGDFVYKNIDDFTSESLSLLKNIKAKEKIFVFGNHDYGYDAIDSIRREFKKIGIKILKNEEFDSKNNNINIFGYDDALRGERIKGISTEKKKFNIALSHNLDSVKKIKNYDLVLSGHLHNGEMNFFFYDGVKFLMSKSEYKNLNRQTTKMTKLYDSGTVSIIHPGCNTSNPLGMRLFTKKEGIVEIMLIPEKI
jgi:predicted MPP superfamily phosphohydrolase